MHLKIFSTILANFNVQIDMHSDQHFIVIYTICRQAPVSFSGQHICKGRQYLIFCYDILQIILDKIQHGGYQNKKNRYG